MVVLCACPLVGSAAVYYIDFTNGSDTNNGTSKTAPWKLHPYMTGFKGNYSHNAGDRFIFKGGVTWTSAAFPMNIPSSGTQASPDYYGVDQSWYASSAWAQPVFDAQNTIPSGGSMVVFSASTQWVTLDNLEIRNMQINNSAGALDHCLVQFSYGAINITVQNSLIHTWSVTTPGVYDQMGGVCGLGPMTNTVLDHSTVYNDDSTANKVSACTFNVDTVTYSTVHDCVEGLFGGRLYHHNLVYNIYKSTDGTAHENGIQAQDANCQVYNNVLHDVHNGTALYIVGATGGVSGTCNVYNNVVYNSVVTNINLDTDQASSGNLNVNVFNNSLDSGGSGAVVRVTNGRSLKWNTVTVRNNHYITDGSTGEDFPSGTYNTLNDSNNLLMSRSTATSQGYTPANFYAPSPSSTGTIAAGMNLTSLNITPLDADRVGVARPSSTAWDAGAYEYNSTGGGSTVAPPTGLSVTVK